MQPPLKKIAFNDETIFCLDWEGMWESEWDKRIKKHEIVHFCFSHINDTDRTAYLRLKLIQDLFFSVKLIITEMSINGKSINYRQSSFWISIMWVSIITSAFHFTAVIFFSALSLCVFLFRYFSFNFCIFGGHHQSKWRYLWYVRHVPVLSGDDLIYLKKKNIFRCARVWFFILYWSLSFSVCKPIAFFLY